MKRLSWRVPPMMIIFVTDPVPVTNTNRLLRLWRPLETFIGNYWPILALGGSLVTLLATTTLWIRRRRLNWSRRSPNNRPSTNRAPRLLLKRKRYPGIQNVGNSCYLNSILQALASVHGQLHIVPTSPFTTLLDNLLSRLNVSQTGTINPSDLIKAMGGSLNNEQQDAHELLQALLSVLAKNTPISSPPSAMITSTHPNGNIYPPRELNSVNAINALMPWEGLQVSCVKCGSCGRVSDAGRRMTTFSILPIPPSTNLESSVAAALAPDLLSDYQCNCGHRNSSVKMNNIVRWPTILLLHVERLGVSSGMMTKDCEWLQFPVRIRAWRQPQHLLGLGDATRPEYELAAVVEHHGGIGGGHYTAFRRIIEANERCRWLHCSDGSVSEVSLEEVLSAQAYLLFYISSTTTIN